MDAMTQSALAQARAAGNINIADSNMEVLDLSERSLAAQERQAEVQMQLEVARRARGVHVPTNPKEVQLKLRELGEPICLFGERAGDRRERLRQVVARRAMESEGETAIATGKGLSQQEGDQKRKDAPTEVSYYAPQTANKLKAMRLKLAEFSFRRAQARISAERELRGSRDAMNACDARANEIITNIKAVQPSASQVGDTRRPLSCCCFSGSTIITGSWSGLVKLWNQDCSARAVLRGHTERVCDVTSFPTSSDASSTVTTIDAASAGADSVAHLWSASSTSPVATLRGHAARLSKVRFHPSGVCVATTSFDKTWRLWDIETQECLQLQEGHSTPVYALAVHPDGSLVSTGDLGGIGRLWDLRSGKSIMTLPGHVKQLLSMDFSPLGFLLATASDDHTVRIWDLRKRDCMYTVPAHQGLVSAVKFAPKTGEFLATSSYDGTIKTWSGRDFSHLAEYSGHEGKISCVDVSASERSLVSCSFDRTFKLWTSFADDDAAADAAAAAADVDMTS